jgi:hypothetical protein
MKSEFRHLLLGLFCAAVLIVAPFLAMAQETPYPWKAGHAAVDITPEAPMWMAGYAARKKPFDGVRQPIFAKAMAIEDKDGSRLIVVTLDLIGVTKSMRTELEEHVQSKHNVPEQGLLINASHTHSGPAIRTFQPPGGGTERVGYGGIPDEEAEQRAREVIAYRKVLGEKLRTVVDQAVAGLAPAQLAYSHARCGFAMNRRTPVGESFKNSPYPEGPVDHDVPVLQVRDGEGKLKAVLFGYACHATTMGDMKIHGDWPGYAQAYFEKDNPGVMCAFLNGCSGDQNPYPRRIEVFLERHGHSMATAIEAALETPPHPLVGPLKAGIAWPNVAYDVPPTREQLVEKSKSKDGYDARHAEMLIAELDAKGKLPESYPVPVQVIRFGDSLTLCAIGGEVVIDYAIRLKKELGEKTKSPVWIAGYSNEVIAYIPSKRIREEGGYEGGGAMRYVRSVIHPGPWAPSVEKTLVEMIYDLEEMLRTGGD